MMARRNRKSRGRGLGRVEIRRMALADLTPTGYNPRIMTDEAREGLSGCVEEFGCVQPIVWNERTGNVVGGHQRLGVLLAAGEVDADVSVVDLDPEREKALNVALNNEHIQGKWDYEGLSSILRGLDDDLRALTYMPDSVLEPLLATDWSPPSIDDTGTFGGEGESGDKKKTHKCPECGHEFEVDS